MMDDPHGRALVEACAGPLREFAFRAPRRLRVAAQDIDDVVQAALYMACTSTTPVPRDREGAWKWLVKLYALARLHHVTREGRRRAREEVVSLEDLPPVPSSFDVEAFCTMVEALRLCMPRLPPGLRVIFQRVDIDGEDVATVAREEHISEEAARKRLQRARTAMKAEIDALDQEQGAPGRCAMVLPMLAGLSDLDRAMVSALLAVAPPPIMVAAPEAAEATEPHISPMSPAAADPPPPPSGVRLAGLSVAVLTTAVLFGCDMRWLGDGRLPIARALPAPTVVVAPAPPAEQASPQLAPIEAGGSEHAERKPRARVDAEFKDLTLLLKAQTAVDRGRGAQAQKLLAADVARRPSAPEVAMRASLAAAAEKTPAP